MQSTETTDSRFLEPLTAMVLGLAAVLTAVAAYLSSVQGGNEDEARADAIKYTAEANAATNAAIQTRAADQAMFASWSESSYSDNDDFAEYLMTLMRPEPKVAIEALGTSENDAPTPFELDDYVIADEQSATETFADADTAEKKAKVAADRGDAYDKSAIFLALALFFAGIATTFRRRLFATGLLAVGTVTLVIGAVQLAGA